MKILVTGGAGFIGSNFIRKMIVEYNQLIINVDKLTYAGNLNSLKDIENKSDYQFINCDIGDRKNIIEIFYKYQPDMVINFAAESHVDRSIDGPMEFVNTNIVGTVSLLQVCSEYYSNLDINKKINFRFLHISTDEVYGTLGENGKFNEQTPYDPSSPYSASKASSDHFVRSWQKTYNY